MRNETTFKEIGLKLFENGYEPIPIRPGTKIPYVKAWNQDPITETRILSWIKEGFGDYNVGLRTGKLIAFDFDLDDENLCEKSFLDLHHFLGRTPLRWGRPGRFLGIYRAEDETQKKKILTFETPNGDKKIEILRSGQQFVAFGNHPDLNRPYSWEYGSPLTTNFLELEPVSEIQIRDWAEGLEGILKWKRKVVLVKDDEKFLVSFKPHKNAESLELIPRINYEGMRDFSWVKNVFGPLAKPTAHGGFRITSKDLNRDYQEDLSIHPDGIRDFGPEKGLTPLKVVAEFHCGGDEKKAVPILARWLGLDPETYQAVKESDDPTMDQNTKKIKDCHSISSLKSCVKTIDLKKLDRLDLDRLQSQWSKRYKEIEGLKPTKRTVLEIFKRIEEAKKTPKIEFLSKLFKEWVYLTDGDVFYHRVKQTKLTRSGFESLFRRELVEYEEFRESKVSCAHLALNELKIPVVTRPLYDPTRGSIYEEHQNLFVNTYIPEFIPEHKDPKDFTDFDKAMIQAFQSHFKYLSGFRSEVETFLIQFFACCVQKPGRKIRFVPLIKGVEGDGKTTLMNLLSACLGPRNTATVGSAVLSSKFNGYAEGSSVVALEEIRVVGQNRFDIMNTLKDVITNEVITVHKKGKDSYSCKNVTNYIAFTNYADAVALTGVDRRWVPIFTPWRSIEEMGQFCSINVKKHFDRLYKGLRNHIPALRGWLLNVDISNFDVDKPGIETGERMTMIQYEKKADVLELEDFISKIDIKKGVFPKVIFGSALERKQRDFIYSGLSENDQPWPRGKRLRKLMMELGWLKIATRDGRLRLTNNRLESLWIRQLDPKCTQTIRKYIDDLEEENMKRLDSPKEEIEEDFDPKS